MKLPAALLLIGAAHAAERPPTLPQRDVDVLYEIAQPVEGGPPLSQRMRWSVAIGRLRVDPPTPGIYMIIDYPNKRMEVVKPEQQAVLDMATAATGLPGAAAGAYQRQDDAVVAGLACTNWQTTDAAGVPTQLCLTPDGVTLRAGQGGRTLLQATRVTYGAQDAAAFESPRAFRHITGSRP